MCGQSYLIRVSFWIDDWNALSLTCTAIITYGPLSFDVMLGKSIHLVESSVESEKRPTSIRVVDVFGCDHNLDLRQCQTYFVTLP